MNQSIEHLYAEDTREPLVGEEVECRDCGLIVEDEVATDWATDAGKPVLCADCGRCEKCENQPVATCRDSKCGWSGHEYGMSDCPFKTLCVDCRDNWEPSERQLTRDFTNYWEGR